MIDGFTLLRSELAWAALPLIAIALLLMRSGAQRGQWQQHIDPTLLPYLLEGSTPKQQRGRRHTAIAALCLLGLIALMGPAWQRDSVPLAKSQDALVIVLDLSPSMHAQDIQPSRLQQAKYKIRDLLALRQDGQTGLVASAGDAFVVAPLTDDGNTLLTLLPSLSPDMMPLPGSNPLAGLRLAQQLLEQGSAGRGRILFIGDGVSDRQWPALKAFIEDSTHRISVLAVGSADGAPIPNREGGFVKDDRGDIVVAQLPVQRLQAMAERGNGQYRELALDDSDIAPFSDSRLPLSGKTTSGDSDQRQADQWQDGGVWLVLLMLPLALLGFHRSVLSLAIGALPALALTAALGLAPSPAQAQAVATTWDSLWRTPDQQGAALMDSDPAAAAETFADPLWRGSAHYRAGHYQAAADAFAQKDSATAHYNRGNALAQAGQLEQAIAAYNTALEKNPELEDAARNRALVKQLQQQSSQQSGSPQSGDQPSGENGQQNQPPGSGANDQRSADGSQGDNQQQSDQQQSGQQASGQQQGNHRQAGDTGQRNQSHPPRQQPPSGAQSGTEDDDTANQASRSPDQQAAQQQSADDYVQQSAAPAGEPGDPPQQANAATSAAAEADESTDQNADRAVATGRLSEEDQAGEQWLRQIPDGSDQLLRNKFRYQYLQRRNNGDVPDDDNYAPY